MEQLVGSLGIGGLAIYILWLMYQSNQKERAEYFKAFRELESDIRNKFSTQLQENTNAMLAHSQIMKEVVGFLAKHQK